ncbi:MAG: hypothetical protein QME93_05010 [Bacillota bacterium]|nr:hypothetical protein [Bacillota bacterium]MDI7249411.1 hypothetical protein [Bacillota bacterium]
MDAAGADRTRQTCRKTKQELDARLAELESRRRELVARLEEVMATSPRATADRPAAQAANPQSSQSASAPGNPTGDCDGQASQRGAPDADPPGHPLAGSFPVGREQELDYCLRLLKLRCRALAEEVAEVALLAEALHSLARAAGGVDARRRQAAPPGAGSSPAPAPGAPIPGVPPATAAPPASAAPPAAQAARAGGAPEAAGADGLAAIISSPQFQKVAAQLLAQLIKK